MLQPDIDAEGAADGWSTGSRTRRSRDPVTLVFGRSPVTLAPAPTLHRRAAGGRGPGWCAGPPAVDEEVLPRSWSATGIGRPGAPGGRRRRVGATGPPAVVPAKPGGDLPASPTSPTPSWTWSPARRATAGMEVKATVAEPAVHDRRGPQAADQGAGLARSPPTSRTPSTATPTSPRRRADRRDRPAARGRRSVSTARSTSTPGRTGSPRASSFPTGSSGRPGWRHLHDATTTLNAMFFAGLKDVEHKPHSFYIDRYPVGREATVA